MKEMAFVTYVDSIEGDVITSTDTDIIVDGVAIARPLLEFRLNNTVFFRRTIQVGEIDKKVFNKERNATGIVTEDGNKLFIYNNNAVSISSSMTYVEGQPESYTEDDEDEDNITIVDSSDNEDEDILIDIEDEDSEEDDGIVFDPTASDSEEDESIEPIDFEEVTFSVDSDDELIDQEDFGSDAIVIKNDDSDDDDDEIKFSDDF